MIIVKQLLSEKEKQEVSGLIDELSDLYSDFYITKDNLRLFIKENKDLFFEALKRGDKVVWDDNGIAFITGWSDKSPRKYIKILAKDEESAEQLIKIIFWNVKTDLWAKIKKENPIRRVLQKNQFKFCGDRGREILLRHEYIPNSNYTKK